MHFWMSVLQIVRLWGELPSVSPPYLRAGPLPWRTSLITLGSRGSGMMGFPKTLRLDLRADFSDF